MALTKEIKEKLAVEYGKGPKDGSLPVQIAVFSERMKELSGKKDKSSQNRMLAFKKIRRQLLSDYKKTDTEACRALAEKLGIGKA